MKNGGLKFSNENKVVDLFDNMKSKSSVDFTQHNEAV
jgi:hypothetical protein